MENESLILEWDQEIFDDGLNDILFEELEQIDQSGTISTPKTKRFASLSSNEMDKILDERHSKGTKRATNWGIATFNGT